MRVAVIGPESTGGRLLRRLLEVHPDLDVAHWSLPHGGKGVRRWPLDEAGAFQPDAVLACVRAWVPSLASKATHHVYDVEAAEEEMRLAYAKLMGFCFGRRWRFVVYESLVASPDELASVFCWLGVPAIAPGEPLTDEDAKWYAGVPA